MCQAVRESLSAESDGEAAPLTARQVGTHLENCASCREWARLVGEVDRRTRVSDLLPPTNLTTVLLGALDADTRRRRSRRQWAAVVLLVALSGLVQAAVSIPLLVSHGDVWRGGWALGLQGVVATSFVAGALMLLWHYRKSVEPLEAIAAVGVPAERSPDAAGEVA